MGLGLIILLVGYCIKQNQKGYSRNVYYVQVSDPAVFDVKPINSSDSNIIAHGGISYERVNVLDFEVDKGDGDKNGNIRWYRCSGIDCDEGWQNRTYK